MTLSDGSRLARNGRHFAAALVTVRWRGDTFAVRRVDDGERAVLGIARGTVAPIPCDMLGCEAFDFVSVRHGEAFVHVPPHAVARVLRADGRAAIAAGPVALAVAVGDRVLVRVGSFDVEAEGAPPVPPRPRARLGRLARAGASFYVLAIALAHGLALAAGELGAHDGPPVVEDDSAASGALVRGYLVAAEARATEPIPAPEANVPEPASPQPDHDARGPRAKRADGSRPALPREAASHPLVEAGPARCRLQAPR